MVEVEDVTLNDDGSIAHPVPVDIAKVMNGLGFDLWNDARRYAVAYGEWGKAKVNAPPTAPNQVPGPIWLYLHKAGARAVKALCPDDSVEAWWITEEDMEVVAQDACVIAWNNLLVRLEELTVYRPRSQWLGVKRTATEMEADENPCLVGRCAEAQRGLHWTMSVGGHKVLAHRLALTLAGEVCPPGLVVRHKCGNRGCINVSHTHWGTVQENNRDQFRDGTAQRFGRRLTAEECAAEWAKPVQELTTAQRLGQAAATLKAFSR